MQRDTIRGEKIAADVLKQVKGTALDTGTWAVTTQVESSRPSFASTDLIFAVRRPPGPER
jgi:hypothetical protein